mgnify:CR=1 FL=1
MIRLKQAVIVEGKYDRIRLSGLIDALIIETGGFAVFTDRERLSLIRRLAEHRGIVVLTDSDSAGFRIRSFLGGSIPPDRIRHVYIPDVYGRERRKSAPGREGKLGVEGMTDDALLEAFRAAGIAPETSESVPEQKRPITKTDLYFDGLAGGPDSAALRARLIRRLGLPQRLSANRLLQVLNVLVTREEYQRLAQEIKSQTGE